MEDSRRTMSTQADLPFSVGSGDQGYGDLVRVTMAPRKVQDNDINPGDMSAACISVRPRDSVRIFLITSGFI